MSANTRLDSLFDLTKHKANLKLVCRCGRVHIFDAQRLLRYAMLRAWNVQLEALRHRMRCRGCRATGANLTATPEPPTPDDPFPRTEAEWTRLHRRLRG